MIPLRDRIHEALRQVRDPLALARVDDLDVEREYLPGLERERRLEGLGS